MEVKYNKTEQEYQITREEIISGKLSEKFKLAFLIEHAKNVGDFLEEFRRWKAESLAKSRTKFRGYSIN